MNLETDNPEKGYLLRRSAEHRELLEADMKQISERSEKVVTNALLIGGALAVTYLLLSSLSGPASKGKNKSRKLQTTEADRDLERVSHERAEEPSMLAHIGGILAAQAAGFLLSIAREKLVEYLQSQGVTKDKK